MPAYPDDGTNFTSSPTGGQQVYVPGGRQGPRGPYNPLDPNDPNSDAGLANRYSYGGYQGGADYNVDRYRDMGADAAGRTAYVVDSNGREADALGLMRDAAYGTAPSRAEILGRRANEGAIAGTMSTAASIKGGPGARVAAMRGAQVVAASQEATGNRDIATLRADEMDRARGAYFGGASTMAGQQLQSEMGQRQLNQQGQQYYEGLAGGVNSEQLHANENAQNEADMRFAGNVQNAQHSSDFDWGKAVQIGGAALSTGGSVAGSISDIRAKEDVYPISPAAQPTRGAPPSFLRSLGAGLRSTGNAMVSDENAKTPLAQGGLNNYTRAFASGNVGAPLQEENDIVRGGFHVPTGVMGPGAAYMPSDARAKYIVSDERGKTIDAERTSRADRYVPPSTPQGRRREETRQTIDWEHAMHTRDPRANFLVTGPTPGGEGGTIAPIMLSDARAKREAFADGAQYAAAAQAGTPPPLPEYAQQLRETQAPRPAQTTGAKKLEVYQPPMGAARVTSKPWQADEDPMAEANRSYEPSAYHYKPGFGEDPNRPNVGPMAQNMAQDPIASTAIVRDPQTGLLAIDQKNATKLALGGLASTQAQLDEQRADIERIRAMRMKGQNAEYVPRSARGR